MLILEWKKSAGAGEDSRELFRFDVDHLTKNAVSKVKCSKVCFPGGEPWIWRVKCSLEEDDGGHRIKVRYAEEHQTGWVKRLLQIISNPDDYIGKTTIFVKRNESGKAEKTGRFKWDPKATNGEIEGRWWAIDGPRPTRTQKQQVSLLQRLLHRVLTGRDRRGPRSNR